MAGDPLQGVAFQSVDDHDEKALTEEQQAQLNKTKIRTAIANERYLREHPEVNIVLSGFIREVLLQRPENIREFGADYFTRLDLARKVNKEKQEIQEQFRTKKDSKIEQI
ncbi:RIIa domain-containing protein 1-like [Corticium candelabrum]|uniref:RIIa domain-containing protein 1-like n=1 Tax=Corticium candelabrum TaxID=121492 RepID=UPI002E26722F|nr:RIIa domain-containing protein 1-like [Corticium candelabrum]